MKQSPEEDKNQNLTDGRINKIVKKAKRKVWLTSMPTVIGAGVFGYAAAYFNQPWLLLFPVAFMLWIFLGAK